MTEAYLYNFNHLYSVELCVLIMYKDIKDIADKSKRNIKRIKENYFS